MEKLTRMRHLDDCILLEWRQSRAILASLSTEGLDEANVQGTGGDRLSGPIPSRVLLFD